MGQRLLQISAELLVEFLRGLRDGPPRYFSVTENPIPADAKILSVRSSQYWPNIVEIELESAAWEPAEPRTKIVPAVTTVFSEP